MDEDLQKKGLEAVQKFLATRPPRRRRHTPAHQQRTMKVQGPSQLAGLDGSRKPGAEVRVGLGQGKAPKRRFGPGDKFEFEGEVWEISHMYRLMRVPGVWMHVLECKRPRTGAQGVLDEVVKVLGAGATTERIVFTPFAHETDASQYFWDLPCEGDQLIRTTQQLMSMKRVTDQGQLPGGSGSTRH
jgi:hypothetical protein